MKPLVALALAVLAGCTTEYDHPIFDVVSLQLQPSGSVDACAAYDHEEDVPTECCTHVTEFRIVRVDEAGGISDENGACRGLSAMLASAPLSDGGSLAFADSNIARLDGSGAIRWTVPSPFGHISAASADRDGFVYLARGPQVARLALADGTVAWLSELR
jgi:hypothetical protein